MARAADYDAPTRSKGEEGFVDLALTDEERIDRFSYGDEDLKRVLENSPRYAYGTKLELGKDELKKLRIVGLGDLPRVGDRVAIIAIGCIESVRYEEREEDEDSLGVTIQLEEMVPFQKIDESSERSISEEVAEAVRKSKGER